MNRANNNEIKNETMMTDGSLKCEMIFYSSTGRGSTVHGFIAADEDIPRGIDRLGGFKSDECRAGRLE
jgi:hypothetical protein